MAKHRLKQKKVKAGKQLRWGLILQEGMKRSGRTPVSHFAEDREGFCECCSHPWAWHDNVWLKMLADGQFVQPKLRCRGGCQDGLSVFACQCRATYPHG